MIKNIIKTDKEVIKFLIKKTNLFSLILSTFIAFIWQFNIENNMYFMGGNSAIIMLFFIFFLIFYTAITLITLTVYLNFFSKIRENITLRFMSFFLLSTIGSMFLLSYNKYNLTSLIIVFFSNFFYCMYFLKFNKFLIEQS